MLSVAALRSPHDTLCLQGAMGSLTSTPPVSCVSQAGNPSQMQRCPNEI